MFHITWKTQPVRFTSLSQWLNIVTVIPFRLMVQLQTHKLLRSSAIDPIPRRLFIAGNVVFGILNAIVFTRVIYSDIIRPLIKPHEKPETDSADSVLDFQLH